MERSITLKHLFIDNKKCIGLQYHADRITQALVNELPGLQWSDQFNMHYISNNESNLSLIFKKLKGFVWINGNYFFQDKPLKDTTETIDVNWLETANSKKDIEHALRPILKNWKLKNMLIVLLEIM